MPVALHVNYHGADFASTIVHAANLLGDADTTAAIAGQLAGAIYGYSGIDSRYVRALRVWASTSCASDAKLMNYHAANDAAEIHLRRLAA